MPGRVAQKTGAQITKDAADAKGPSPDDLGPRASARFSIASRDSVDGGSVFIEDLDTDALALVPSSRRADSFRTVSTAASVRSTATQRGSKTRQGSDPALFASSQQPPRPHLLAVRTIARGRPNSWHSLPSVDESEQPPQPAAPTSPDSRVSNDSSVPFPPSGSDKASRMLGIRHQPSMEPIPASARTSMVSTRSTPAPAPPGPAAPPLTSLYLVSGLPKSATTWTLADNDAVMGLNHSEGAVNRWWRPEVLGSTVSPGAGGAAGKKGLKKKQSADLLKGVGGVHSKQEVSKMLSKALKLSFTREVEVIASTLQPASTVHTFTFELPASTNPYGASPSGDLLRNSVFTGGAGPAFSAPATPMLGPGAGGPHSFLHADPYARPSSMVLGGAHGGGPPLARSTSVGGAGGAASAPASGDVTYHGVCLTVWSHADAERTAAIRRALDGGRMRKESAHSLRAARLRTLRSQAGASSAPRASSRRRRRAYSDVETEPDGETDAGGITESEYDGASTVGHAPGESTVFLPGDAVFWLPYALTLVSRYPIYDLMRDYLTLSWARFSKDVQAHTLQISKILAQPAPRAGELVRLDASAKTDGPETSLEVVARFPGGMDFGQGLVDTNITMWPLFKALSVEHILTICEIALAPTGRVLFYSRHPAMLGIAVSTVRYLLELRGWTGIALPAVHCRDAKIYTEDPGPWLIGLATEARYAIRPPPEVCVVDLDINYLQCAAPPPGVVSTKQQRDRYRARLLTAFEPHYHPDHCVPAEFKEAFPAGRFRPVCRIQAKRGASPTAVADAIPSPDWWNSTRVIQAFDEVLRDRTKKPSLLRRIASLGSPMRPPQLTPAEVHITGVIRRRALGFIDAQDELQSRIGRLSRRLNFLMTEADTWRDKFVTFESYAEKLSAEAGDLRTKIGREQRDARRMSAINAAEKTALQQKLQDTEDAHKKALADMDAMKEQMRSMEAERADMIAEVEAQIEHALQSMAVGIDAGGDDEYAFGGTDDEAMRITRSRKASVASLRSAARQMRSLGTESTLAPEEVPPLPKSPSEEKEQDPMHRFSVTGDSSDAMVAVDEGISKQSDQIAEKVARIQAKLEGALASEPAPAPVPRWKGRTVNNDSESEYSADDIYTPRAPRRRKESSGTNSNRTSATVARPSSSRASRPPSAQSHKPPSRASRHRKNRNSMTGSIASSVLSGTATVKNDSSDTEGADERASHRDLPRLATATEIPEEEARESMVKPTKAGPPSAFPTSMSKAKAKASPSTPSLTPGPVASTDDSDSDAQDYQSAYSMSRPVSTLDPLSPYQVSR